MVDAADTVSLRGRIEQVLDRVRPHLRGDGADVELIDVKGEVVQLRFVGECIGCPMSKMILIAGLEQALREALPQILRVDLVKK
jgi:Fe-S cluster biogenesis protein NfuA